MSHLIICLLAIFGLTFLVRQSDGPWDIMSHFRRLLINNKYIGVFCFKLLDCAFCSGCWSGIIVYWLATEAPKLAMVPVWCLAGGTVCLMMEAILTRLSIFPPTP